MAAGAAFKIAIATAIVTIFVSVFVTDARAETLSVSLAQSSRVSSTSAVINSSLGQAHPPLQVESWDAGGGAQSTSISVGDGANGSFVESRYLLFHDGAYNNDHVLRINTDVYSELNFTDFTLESNWTLRPTGSRPLVIRSQSTMVINGLIDCSGGNGSDLNAATSTTSAGGSGICGGATGGSGGSTSASASDGSEPSTNAGSRGRAGAAQSGGGGGGGGMDTSAPAPGTGLQIDDATPSGAAGSVGSDVSFSSIGGGAGGGGGEMYDNIADPVTEHASGAGGGAGGGSIYLYAVGSITVASGNGAIRAQGGNGGGSASVRKAGAGGGGAGGSILVFSGGQVVINGVINALGGTGGVSAGGNGGAGGAGRSWVVDSDTNPSGTGSLDPGSSLPTTGTVNYRTGNFEIISQLLDLNSTRPTLQSASVDATVSGASTVTLQIAASDAPFDSSTAQWVASTALSSASGKRYLRFRVLINNQSTSSPAVARSVSIVYQPSETAQFDFASCQLTKSSAPPPGGFIGWILAFLALLPLIFWSRLKTGTP